MKSFRLLRITAAAMALITALTMTACDNGTTSNGSEVQNSSVEQEVQVNAKVSVSDGKFTVDGKQFWINGVNTPWHHWNDFTGVMDEAFWDKTLEALSNDGINCTRIWINCEGEGVVRLKSTGELISINEGHWSDMDKLFALAEKHKVYIMPTFLSFDHCKEGHGSYKKWRAFFENKTAIDQYAEQYVKEFCLRYGEHPYLFGIDLMNEPDWVYENAECGKIGWDSMAYFFGKCADTIHNTCSTPVTVGIGIIKYNSDKYEGNKVSDEYLKEQSGCEKAYLDFYSTHYYNWQKPYFGFPYDRDLEQFGLSTDKPCLIGETHNDDFEEVKLSLTEKYEKAMEQGWQGVMVWMQTDDNGEFYRYDLTKEATTAMYDKYTDLIDPLGLHKSADSGDVTSE